LDAVLGDATLAVALTEYSPSAPLAVRTRAAEDFRVATLPGVARRMEETALAADYTEVARRCEILARHLRNAGSGDVLFATGHRCHFDLRHREPHEDNGQLPRHGPGRRLINLPSGEVYMTPYEGEVPGEESETCGELPAFLDGEVLEFAVEHNVIVGVRGTEPTAARWRAFFAEDRARANIAEFAFGCNPMAVVWGNVLEDEKAGFHWAYGRSEFLGGIVSAGSFKTPAHVVHQDIVHAKGSPIGLQSVHLNRADGSRVQVIREGDYLLF
jgi:leucyl aminopeptidase (aminopeptidase T)